jgi:hypothetical protein
VLRASGYFALPISNAALKSADEPRFLSYSGKERLVRHCVEFDGIGLSVGRHGGGRRE